MASAAADGSAAAAAVAGLEAGLQGLSLSAPDHQATASTGPDGTGHEQAPHHLRVAGGGAAMQALRELIAWPSQYAQEGAALGVAWPRGLLLHGPPGCGKTLMVQAVAEEVGAALHVVAAADVFGAYVGESERRLREAFEAAREEAAAGRVAVVFLDEVDALCPRRDGTRQHESRVVAQLLTLLDGAASASPASSAPAGPCTAAQQPPGHLVVVAATNRPNALDPALRRPGRLDREVAVGVPGPEQRAEILGLHLGGLKLAPGLDLPGLAASCHGYSGADLAALAREAALSALARAALGAGFGAGADASAAGAGPAGAAAEGGSSGSILGAAAAVAGLFGWGAGAGAAQMPEVVVGAEDIAAGMRRVGPSIVRGIEAEVPHTSWEDVGGLEEVKTRLRQAVEWPLRRRAAFERLGLAPPRGVLLYGPPGCSKTTLARAAASASGATLIPLSCAQLFSAYVGEGEAMLRDVFRRARAAAPAIVLLDEVDAVAARREEGADAASGRPGGGEAGVRLLTALLTEMDGLDGGGAGVLVLGATNRPGAVDAALMRPGRFDALLYVPPPDAAGRLQVLRIHTRAMPLAEDVDLGALADTTQDFTGAELAALCREAALAALREDLSGGGQVCARHFGAARAATRAPALSKEALAGFEEWGRKRRGGAGPAQG